MRESAESPQSQRSVVLDPSLLPGFGTFENLLSFSRLSVTGHVDHVGLWLSVFPPTSHCHAHPESSLGLQSDYVPSLLNTLQNLPHCLQGKTKIPYHGIQSPYFSSHAPHSHPKAHGGHPKCSQPPVLPCPDLSRTGVYASFSVLLYLANSTPPSLWSSAFPHAQGWARLLPCSS